MNSDDFIQSGLKKLFTAKNNDKIFGADTHKFRLNPPLPESIVLNFEKKHKISLPQDYRNFLIKIGNGGAGPFYGIFKLGEMDDNFNFSQWKENNGFVGILSKPFPHNLPWNDLTGDPDDFEDEEAYDKALDEFDKKYWNTENINGAIPICHRGCALRNWLVITGEEAGNIWNDDRADKNGLNPVSIDGKSRVNFIEWYKNWIKESLEQIK